MSEKITQRPKGLGLKQTPTFTIIPCNETAIIGKIGQLKVCILNSINSLNVMLDVLKEKVLPSMALSENVSLLVQTVDKARSIQMIARLSAERTFR